MTEQSIKSGDVIQVTTEGVTYGGDAIARFEGLAVFIPFAAPAERLRVRITERKKTFARGVIEEILAPSESRREAPCSYFGVCGGCQLQHLDYSAQLAAKAAFVRDSLTRIGKLDWPHEITVAASPEFGYRTRAQVKIERLDLGADSELRIGFSRAGSHSVCDVEDCPILVPELNSSLHSLRSVLNRSLQRRNAFLAGRRVAEVEMAAGDSAVSFEPSFGGLPQGPANKVVRGAVYDFTAATFFQVNRFLLDALVEEAVGSESGEFALDLYAGVGLFTAQLARLFKRVIGIESDGVAAAFAQRNFSANNIENVEFYAAPVEVTLKQLIKSRSAPFVKPDLILLDPPRSGAAGAAPAIINMKPSRITYVSCDPTTLARDLRELAAGGYQLTRVVAFDFFPQTYHVETVAHLVLR